jgi:hypothetical protein
LLLRVKLFLPRHQQERAFFKVLGRNFAETNREITVDGEGKNRYKIYAKGTGTTGISAESVTSQSCARKSSIYEKDSVFPK